MHCAQPRRLHGPWGRAARGQEGAAPAQQAPAAQPQPQRRREFTCAPACRHLASCRRPWRLHARRLALAMPTCPPRSPCTSAAPSTTLCARGSRCVRVWGARAGHTAARADAGYGGGSPPAVSSPRAVAPLQMALEEDEGPEEFGGKRRRGGEEDEFYQEAKAAAGGCCRSWHSPGLLTAQPEHREGRSLGPCGVVDGRHGGGWSGGAGGQAALAWGRAGRRAAPLRARLPSLGPAAAASPLGPAVPPQRLTSVAPHPLLLRLQPARSSGARRRTSAPRCCPRWRTPPRRGRAESRGVSTQPPVPARAESQDAARARAGNQDCDAGAARQAPLCQPTTPPPHPTHPPAADIEKNRGLTPHRRKDLKNPRKKHRHAPPFMRLPNCPGIACCAPCCVLPPSQRVPPRLTPLGRALCSLADRSVRPQLPNQPALHCDSLPHFPSSLQGQVCAGHGAAQGPGAGGAPGGRLVRWRGHRHQGSRVQVCQALSRRPTASGVGGALSTLPGLARAVKQAGALSVARSLHVLCLPSRSLTPLLFCLHCPLLFSWFHCTSVN